MKTAITFLFLISTLFTEYYKIVVKRIDNYTLYGSGLLIKTYDFIPYFYGYTDAILIYYGRYYDNKIIIDRIDYSIKEIYSSD